MNTKNKNKKKNIQYGNTDLSDEMFEPKNIKRRITLFLDLDALSEVKKRAKKDGIGYQTKINQLIRDAVLGPSDIEKRLRKIEKQIFNQNTSEQL